MRGLRGLHCTALTPVEMEWDGMGWGAFGNSMLVLISARASTLRLDIDDGWVDAWMNNCLGDEGLRWTHQFPASFLSHFKSKDGGGICIQYIIITWIDGTGSMWTRRLVSLSRSLSLSLWHYLSYHIISSSERTWTPNTTNM